MSRRTLFIAIGLLALFWAAAAVLVQADNQKITDVAAARPITQATIPAPPGTDVSLTVFPEVVCPGYNLYYTFWLTNTSETSTLSGIEVMAELPEGTWFDARNANQDLGGNIPGVYKEYYDDVEEKWYRWFEWQTKDDIDPGERIEARVTLHSYTSLPQDKVITATFQYQAYSATQPGLQVMPLYSISVESRVDRGVCQATVTPTPTNTPEPTSTFTPTPTEVPTDTPTPTPTLEPTEEPTPIVYNLILPLIFN